MARAKPWLILELSEYGETITYPELVSALASIFGDGTEYFIPTHYEQIGSYTAQNTLFEGYAFVKDSEAARKSAANLADSRVFSRALKRGNKFQTLSTKEIESLRKKLKISLKRDFEPGLRVKILDGLFQNMEGEIQYLAMEKTGQMAYVVIKCISREVIAPVPTTCLERIEG